MSLPPKCSHGVGFGPQDHCVGCRIVWHEDLLRIAEGSVARHTAEITKLRAALANADTSDATTQDR